MSALAGAVGAIGLALYAGHHVGDYWVQTDHQAQHKGQEGSAGVIACAMHVGTYTLTQAVFLGVTAWVADFRWNVWAFLAGLTVSAVSHYLADRREYGIMFRIARLLPGKARFLTLGVPRAGLTFYGHNADHTDDVEVEATDNPSLGTGAWALDQSWHIFWGVFVAALVIAGLS